MDDFGTVGGAAGAEVETGAGVTGCRVAEGAAATTADAGADAGAVALESAGLGSLHAVSDSASTAPAAQINFVKSAPS
jgi:hypothetical protein